MHAEIAIVGEAPGYRECQLGQPMVGGSGKLLWDTLRKYGITRNQVWTTNVVKRQLAFEGDDDKKEKINRNELSHWQGLLSWELNQLPNLKYLVLLGNFALEACLGERGITNWRGSVVQFDGRYHIIAFNPAMVLRDLKWETAFAFDIAKLDRVIRGKYQKYDITHHINPSPAEAIAWIDKMQDDKLPMSFDIETINGETACFGLANHNHEGMCISFRDRIRNTYTTAEELAIRKRFQRFTIDPSTRIIGQNLSFDAGWLWYKDRIRIPTLYFDTLLAHHTLYPTLPHSLGFLTTAYTDHPYYKDEKQSWREGGDIDTFWRYNVKDACITRKCHERLMAELQAQKLDDFFFNHVMRLQPHLIEMGQANGVFIDTEMKAQVADELGRQVEDLLVSFHQAVANATGDPDYRPNPRSPKQMGELYFHRLRLVGRGTSSDDDNRKRMLAHPRTNEAAKSVLRLHDEYAEEAKFYGTYAASELDGDCRLRTEWKQFGTQTAPGRLSSTQTHWKTGMNCQNQPERSKGMFIAPPGMRKLYFDLSQAEARVVSRLWNVTPLIENFELAETKGVDVHRANAARIFKVPYESIPAFDFWVLTGPQKNIDDPSLDGKPTLRYLGKRCVHGLNYRMQPDRLATVCNIPYSQAHEAHRAYHMAFPQIKEGWEDTVDEVYKTKELWSPFGRRLKFLGRLPPRNAEPGTVDATALDSIIAFKPQSCIGDKVASCIYLCHDDPEWDTRRARCVIDIHDALIAYVPDNDGEALHYARIMKKHAEAPLFIKGEPLVIPADLKWSIPDEQGLHRWRNLVKVKSSLLSTAA